MSEKISFDKSEIEGFFNELSEIAALLEKATQEAVKIGELNFYKDGQADSAVKALANVPGKYNAAVEHYTRLGQLLQMTWVTMAEADGTLAKQIGPVRP
ncbi:hypothetical protein ACYSNR_00435 [Enterococcus sp. LJL128]|uniref:hypothetical protein n=1 Tax=Enterococcus sp. LJL51 TaxID=3416656 RepID=UPI003CF02972